VDAGGDEKAEKAALSEFTEGSSKENKILRQSLATTALFRAKRSRQTALQVVDPVAVPEAAWIQNRGRMCIKQRLVEKEPEGKEAFG